MRGHSLLLAVLAAFSSCDVVTASPSCQSNLLVRTNEGKVHGAIPNGFPGVRQFSGIPYAKPPLDDLRFAAPQPAEKRNGVLDASRFPPSCPQILENWNANLYIRDVNQFNLQGLNRTGATSEDCLTLSVFTPSRRDMSPHSKLPVLIYIYGGSFTTGGQDIPYQNPTQWVQRTQSHIVVVFNYRVSFFGFPSSAALPLRGHNLGLQDQRLAVQWVHANIASFGGDPERMVLWGQSAGAMSVASYSYAYPEDPIVKCLIQDSGSEGVFELLHATAPASYSNFTFVAKNVGCGGLEDDPQAELACMRKVPYDKIEAFRAEWSRSRGTPALSFAPFYDNVTVFENFKDRAETVGIAKIPLILGTNTGDWLGLWGENGINEVQADALIQRIFLCPAHRSAINRANLDLPTYRYLYAGNFSNIAPRPWQGAYHQSEIPLLFGTHANYRGNSTELEWETSHAMQDAWLAFARDGVEGLAAVDWPVWDNSTGGGVVRVFGDGVPAKTGAPDDLEKGC
ncbi:acetylcholinesterase [Microdochium trichocladiopsis]|uniref:Carboxylic ester hydrolase n=1 Tax=Microdochium trichocladiopsis TaxID=1682393 RepID=A0A9P8XXW3_9PEZI|nr:acetylcholinesterase [Microdochium trichocladiopsis]KAH7024812.1 acetylcholinesterase [Microdochium trichocladiopsis]